MSQKKFPRQFLWVSQDFYNYIMGEAKRLNAKGVSVGCADLTHKLIHDIRLPEKVSFDRIVLRGAWNGGSKKKWKMKEPRTIL